MISIIIPCFNAQHTIISALESLSEQSYRDFEVIIINDGSTDESERVINEYHLKNKNINLQCINQTNQGVSAARNRGIAESSGDYLAFLDADDAYTKDYLQGLIDAIDNGKYDIAFCKYEHVKKQTDSITCSPKNVQEVLNKYEILDRYIHKRKTRLGFWGALYKRSIILENNIFFPIDIKYGEDSVFICKYIFHCINGVSLSKPMYKYLVSNTSVMHQNSYEKSQNINAFLLIADYWSVDDSFDSSIGEYMVDRAVWAAAKEFCVDDSSNFDRLISEYDVKTSMRNMFFNGDEILIRISAIVYLVNPHLFYSAIKTYNKSLGKGALKSI